MTEYWKILQLKNKLQFLFQKMQFLYPWTFRKGTVSNPYWRSPEPTKENTNTFKREISWGSGFGCF
jgi:hypothetical protein